MSEKDLNITEVRGAKANIPDIKVYGDGDTFALLCKASSQDQGWMKSTKVCNVPNGAIVQVSTQQRNPDGSYSVAEALAYVPGVHLDKTADPRVLREIEYPKLESVGCATPDPEREAEWERRHRREQYLSLLIEANRAGADVGDLIREYLVSFKPE